MQHLITLRHAEALFSELELTRFGVVFAHDLLVSLPKLLMPAFIILELLHLGSHIIDSLHPFLMIFFLLCQGLLDVIPGILSHDGRRERMFLGTSSICRFLGQRHHHVQELVEVQNAILRLVCAIVEEPQVWQSHIRIPLLQKVIDFHKVKLAIAVLVQPGILGSKLRLPRRVRFFVATLAALIHEDGCLGTLIGLTGEQPVQELIVLDGPIHVHIHTGEHLLASCLVKLRVQPFQHTGKLRH
mmetsp:Transcript_6566/g.11273  ORF Transcript_6566/g.11273 Transcript_6566/m.11273 type:complete len:243 (+) Transcript_6566:231-959(+)